MLNVQRQVHDAITDVVGRHFGLSEVPPFSVEVPPSRALGDLAVTVAFQLARTLRKAPRAIAQEIAGVLGPVPGIARVVAAPTGYLNIHEKNSAWVEVDPQLGHLVTKAFQEMATGNWTLKEWANHVYSLGHRSRKGFRIAVGIWSSIFHSRFYLGETWLKKGDMPTKGNHEALTDEDTFNRVQEVLRVHDNYKQRTQRHKYLLQGMLYSEDTKTPCFVETH
ncbi:MAG: hypothetical protein HYY41_02155 [Chloroflexi bacterium]|nr:hypothetical protein [Chloroflexota bacterium]